MDEKNIGVYQQQNMKFTPKFLLLFRLIWNVDLAILWEFGNAKLLFDVKKIKKNRPVIIY